MSNTGQMHFEALQDIKIVVGEVVLSVDEDVAKRTSPKCLPKSYFEHELWED